MLKPVLYLSYFFKQHRAEYYENLQSVRDTGHWETWLTFFLRGVAEASAEATKAIRRMLTMREEHRAAITAHLGRLASKGLMILDTLYQRPILSVVDVRKLTGSSYPAANHLVVELTKVNILEEITGRKRNRLFRYSLYLQIFEESPKKVVRRVSPWPLPPRP